MTHNCFILFSIIVVILLSLVNASNVCFTHAGYLTDMVFKIYWFTRLYHTARAHFVSPIDHANFLHLMNRAHPDCD